MRLNHVGICVKDMEKSIEFYQDTLGLTKFLDEILSGPDADAAFMVKDSRVRMVILLDEVGNVIELLQWLSHPVKENTLEEHQQFTTVGIVEVCLMVNDLEETGKKLIEKGYSFRTPTWTFGKEYKSYRGAYTRMRYVVDPNGIQVEIMEIVPPEDSSSPNTQIL